MRHSDRGALIGLLLVAGCASVQTSSVTSAASPITADAGRLTAHAPAVMIAAAATVAPEPREIVLADAEQLIGTPYRYGGNSPTEGFDCSGFVRWVFSRQGIDLPRTARAIAKSGVRVPARRAVLLPGDLLFFAEEGGAVSHVAIYAGEGRIIHASSGQGAVRYEELDSGRGEWFRRHVVSARRIMADARVPIVEARSTK